MVGWFGFGDLVKTGFLWVVPGWPETPSVQLAGLRLLNSELLLTFYFLCNDSKRYHPCLLIGILISPYKDTSHIGGFRIALAISL